MLTLKLSGCSKLKSLPNLDATILSGSGHLNTETTMEVPAAIMVQAIMVHHSTIQDSRPGECETPLINLQHKPENPDLCLNNTTIQERACSGICISTKMARFFRET